AGAGICMGQSYTIHPSGATSYIFSGGSAIVSPSVTTTYSVTGMASGCSSAKSATMLLTVNPLPTLVISGNNSVCAGSSITQQVSGSALTFTWSDGTKGNLVNLTPSATTIYSVSGTDANTCKNSVSETITVNPLPIL